MEKYPTKRILCYIIQSVYFCHLQRSANEEEAIEFDKYLCDEVFAAEILQRKYQSMSTEEVAKLQTIILELNMAGSHNKNEEYKFMKEKYLTTWI